MEDGRDVIINQLSELPSFTNDPSDILPKNNGQWQKLMVSMDNKCNNTDNIIKPHIKPLQNELKKEVHHILNVIKVLNSKQPDALLDDIILSMDNEEKNKENQTNDKKDWMDIIKTLQATNNELKNNRLLEEKFEKQQEKNNNNPNDIKIINEALEENDNIRVLIKKTSQ